MWCLGIFADMPPGHLLVKVSLGVQLGFSHMHPDPAEVATNCGLLLVPNRFLRTSHGQHLTLACTGSLPKGSEHTQGPASDNIKAGSNKLHKKHFQREISADTKTCRGEFCFMWSASAQQLTCHGKVASHSCSLRSISHMNRPKAIKTTTGRPT